MTALTWGPGSDARQSRWGGGVLSPETLKGNVVEMIFCCFPFISIQLTESKDTETDRKSRPPPTPSPFPGRRLNRLNALVRDRDQNPTEAETCLSPWQAGDTFTSSKKI